MKKALLLLMSLAVLSCQTTDKKGSQSIDEKKSLEYGSWKFSFLTQKHEIPIRGKFEKDRFFLVNATEEIELNYTIKGDSLYIPIPNFDSHLEAVIQSPSQIKGVYVKDYVDDYSIQFMAERSDVNVFGNEFEKPTELKTKYITEFDYGESKSLGIGIFKQKDHIVSGSFAKETGDYRFLEGVVSGSKLKLSTFDGSHLYLFTADIKGDSLVNGRFISGKGGDYNWSATYSENAELRDPESLTYLKEGYSQFSFSAINLSNETLTLDDERFNAKLKIIQIMGTWCPNCLDETRYFTELHKKYNDKGLEIIALAFENGSDTLRILDKLSNYKQNNSIPYPILYAGRTGSANASKAFPFLNKIMSFPTAIYLNEKNEVLKIYTGFYGPGTGEYYFEYTSNTEAYINSILN